MQSKKKNNQVRIIRLRWGRARHADFRHHFRSSTSHRLDIGSCYLPFVAFVNSPCSTLTAEPCVRREDLL